MSTVPPKYQPSTRLVDDPEQLRQLYCEEKLTVREIADNHAQVGSTAVGEALQEHGITGDNGSEDSKRGIDPPVRPVSTETVDWSTV